MKASEASGRTGSSPQDPAERRSSRRSFLAKAGGVGLGVAAAPLLSACGDDDGGGGGTSTGGGSGRELVVATMPGPRWEGALRTSIETYKKANPNARVKLVVSPFTEHYQRIATSLATDSSAFDVFVFDAAMIGQSYTKLAPLNDLFDTDAQWRDYYLENTPVEYRGSWDYEDQIYSVVHDSNSMMAWWRTDIFEQEGLEEPATFETMLANAKALNAVKGESGFMTTAAGNNFLAVLVTGMMWSFGGRWWENDLPEAYGRISKDNPPGAVLLDSPENVEAMTMLRDLVNEGSKASLNAQETENVQAFVNGVTYQQLMFSGLMQLQDPKYNPDSATKLTSRDFPIGGSNTDPLRTGVKGGYGLAIPKASKSLEGAFDFCKHVVSEDNEEAFIRGGGQPANIATLNKWAERPGFQVFATIAEGIVNGHHQAQFPEGGEFYEVLWTAGGKILTGDMTPEEGCKAMKADTEALLKRAGYV